tara:strand:+ start:1188 stop:1343 length:156 start_codon:yes stop_codon:yes gene_type:complete
VHVLDPGRGVARPEEDFDGDDLEEQHGGMGEAALGSLVANSFVVGRGDGER